MNEKIEVEKVLKVISKYLDIPKNINGECEVKDGNLILKFECLNNFITKFQLEICPLYPTGRKFYITTHSTESPYVITSYHEFDKHNRMSYSDQYDEENLIPFNENYLLRCIDRLFKSVRVFNINLLPKKTKRFIKLNDIL